MKDLQEMMSEALKSASSHMTPETLAGLFAAMDSSEQARFFNEVGKVASEWPGMGLPMQLQYITDEDGLDLRGRHVMSTIGEYSHWGLCRWDVE